MRSATIFLSAFIFAVSLLAGGSVFAYEIDDTVPEVTDRVARFSFIRGDVQIRHTDSEDWEKAVLNLPVVEGDEITAGPEGRFEIQFNAYTYLRVSEGSYLKITGLKDEGIALSLPEGSLSLSVLKFDSDNSFIEIDAPRTTLAVQHSGRYRIDAGKPGDQDIRVSVADDGEARIYSETSGFTLKSGRSAKIFIEGTYAGEWEVGDFARWEDDFDRWSASRDGEIAQKLKKSHYDTYYDQDIYGAEDLSGYGDWTYSSQYGYIWSPYSSAIANYYDWSPYRYGQWRWLPIYGWTWINDEPWGWATYHHGRWIWYRGRWHWAPYGYYRTYRSWWRPALVVISIFNNNVCWYPLPYNYRYYNYNHHWYARNDRRRRGWNNGGNVSPTPSPVPAKTPWEPQRQYRPGAPSASVPAAGVVTVSVTDFGRTRGGFKKATNATATKILRAAPVEPQRQIALPTYQDLGGRISTDIRPQVKPAVEPVARVNTGAAPRTPAEPLDRRLQKSRMLGDRPSVPVVPIPPAVRADTPQTEEPRPTGAVARPVGPIRRPTQIVTEPTERRREPVKTSDPAARTEPIQRSVPVVREPVRTPKPEPPTQRQAPPRNEPTLPSNTGRTRPDTKPSPPPAQRNEPNKPSSPPVQRNEPGKPSSPPPTKSEPSKPSSPPPTRSEPNKPAESRVDRRGKES